ncbi:MAG: hypothetical protein EOM25_07460, partial [Deltaproteobacteria bacterium]|nr:hypothetical protein [Deltaproteobacteria bacterium]
MSQTVSRYFILTAILFFLVACLEGLMFPLKNALSGAYAALFHIQQSQIREFFTHFVTKIHTHIALVGWASSALMGILYFLAPQMAGADRTRAWAAYGNYFCHTLGVILLTGGFHLIGHFGAGLVYESAEFRAAVQPVKTVVIMGGGLILLSGLLFAYNMARTLLGRQSDEPRRRSKSILPCTALAALAALVLGLSSPVAAKMSAAPERIEAVMIGDRLVDVAYNLGVLPRAMAVRATFWPLTETFRGGSEILGCPNRVFKKPETVPDAAKRLGLTRVIVEKNASFCMYMPSLNPEKIIPLLQGKGLTVEYVDFDQGLEAAVRQTAKLLGRGDAVAGVLEKYEVAMAAAKEKTKTVQTGKKVLILSGIRQQGTGKVTIQIEAPGGYTDRFILGELGATNVGDA